jgi:hypothetical protein
VEKKKSLLLNREVLRQLRQSELKEIRGGRFPDSEPGTCPAGTESVPPSPDPS